MVQRGAVDVAVTLARAAHGDGDGETALECVKCIMNLSTHMETKREVSSRGATEVLIAACAQHGSDLQLHALRAIASLSVGEGAEADIVGHGALAALIPAASASSCTAGSEHQLQALNSLMNLSAAPGAVKESLVDGGTVEALCMCLQTGGDLSVQVGTPSSSSSRHSQGDEPPRLAPGCQGARKFVCGTRGRGQNCGEGGCRCPRAGRGPLRRGFGRPWWPQGARHQGSQLPLQVTTLAPSRRPDASACPALRCATDAHACFPTRGIWYLGVCSGEESGRDALVGLGAAEALLVVVNEASAHAGAEQVKAEALRGLLHLSFCEKGKAVLAERGAMAAGATVMLSHAQFPGETYPDTLTGLSPAAKLAV